MPIGYSAARSGPRATTETSATAAVHRRTRRLLWFAGIWLVSVALTILGAAVLKWLFGAMLGSRA